MLQNAGQRVEMFTKRESWKLYRVQGKMTSLETLQSASYENMRVWRKHGLTRRCCCRNLVSFSSFASCASGVGWQLALAPPFCLKNNRNCKSVQHYAKSVFNENKLHRKWLQCKFASSRKNVGTKRLFAASFAFVSAWEGEQEWL